MDHNRSYDVGKGKIYMEPLLFPQQFANTSATDPKKKSCESVNSGIFRL